MPPRTKKPQKRRTRPTVRAVRAVRASTPVHATTSNGAQFNFLFRFRDLIAPTISEHKDIIKKQNKCWWGWWKRPLEDTRLEVWSELEKKIEDSGSTKIGLFDSGTEKIYIATIDKVISPETTGDEGDPIALPSADLKLVPKYYRDSPFSRAWLRITRIDDYTGKFFREWSYAAPPAIPNQNQTTLERLHNKIISDGGELRAMDTTIWSVRPKAVGDKEETIITAGNGPVSAISATPIPSHGEYILHISDPHFATGIHREKHI